MADAGLPWSIPNAGFSIQPINGEFAAWSRGSSVPPDGWSVLSGTWSSTLSRCQGGTGPYAVDFGQAGIPSTLVSDYIVVLPNTRYLLSALYRIVTGSGAALSQGVRVDWYDDSRSLISSNNVDLITNTAGVWTYSGADITSPIQAVYAKVVVGRFNVNGSTNLQVDAIKLDRAVYIPSGVISLDDITDGVTYARPRGDGLIGGYPKLDSVVDGTLFRKVGVGYVDASNRITAVRNTTTNADIPGSAVFSKAVDTLGAITDGGGFSKVNAASVTGGEVTSLSRGGTVYATSTFFQKALDNLSNVADGGGFRRTADSYVDASGRITSVFRSGSPESVDNLFKKGADTFASVAGTIGSTQFGTGVVQTGALADYAITNGKLSRATDPGGAAVGSTNIVDGAVLEAKIGTGAVTVNKIGASAVTEAKIDTGAVTNTKLGTGAVTDVKILDGAVIEAKIGTGAVTVNKIGTGAVTEVKIDTEAVTNTKLGTLSVSSGKIQNGAVNTLQLADDAVTSIKILNDAVTSAKILDANVTTSKIANGNVTTAKVADLGITASKLDDGPSLSAYDEATPQGIFDRSTATNCTKNGYDGSAAYIRFTLPVGATNPQVSTTLYTGSSTNAFTTEATMRYRILGGAIGKVTAVTAINNANTAQTASAVFLADGNWHTASFDISGWTTVGTLRIDLSCTALATSGSWDISYLSTGNAGSGTGALISYQRRVGINVPTPAATLQVAAPTTTAPSLTWNAAAGQILRSENSELALGLSSVSPFPLYLQGRTSTSTSRNISLQPLGGNVGVGDTAPDAVLKANTISGGFVGMFQSSSSAAAAFPELSVRNYSAGGGFPVLATYMARGTSVSPASPNSGDSLGAWVAYGRTLSSFTEGGRMQWTTTAAPGTGTLTTALDFYTSNNAASSAKARLSAAGRLYIGGAVDAEELVEARTGSSAYGFLHSNGTIKLGSYISTTEAQFGTKSNHDISLFTNNGAGRLRIMAAGDVRVPALAGVGNRAVYSDADGDLTNTASDATLKKDIQPLNNVLPVVMRMNPVSFSWKDQERFGPWTEVGFLAQEMLELVPFVVGKNSDDTFTIDYPKLTAVLARAIQELKQQVDELASSRS